MADTTKRIMKFRRPPVEPPVNARIRHDDGRVIPLECRYIGWNRKKGAHQWLAVTPVRIDLEAGWAVSIDKLPAKTTVTVHVITDKE